MKLKSIQIKNYRSIDDAVITITQCPDGSLTFGLIGINEAGKSSLLKAISLKDGLHPVALKDFRDKKNRVEVRFDYEFEEGDFDGDVQGLMSELILNDSEVAPEDVGVESATLITYFDSSSPTIKKNEVIVHTSVNDVTVSSGINFDLVLNASHKVIFWTAESRYLLSEPITLTTFANNPDAISIPLKNCFALAGITGTEIPARISQLPSESTEREELEKNLGESVTAHIKNVWPNHPIEITFNYDSGVINFHIKDVGVKGKAKTADQRSDGFKQFISFLLTISAQSKYGQLSNSILLLDEPETHLHPQAQQFLLEELIKISNNNKTNNLVFFATHSNYMIDKKDLSRNFKVTKADNDKTTIERFDNKISSYSSVNYEVFEIPTSDYHNELYSKLHEKHQNVDLVDESRNGIKNFDLGFFQKEKGLKADRPWKKKANQITLSTYIRNCINHSDNGDTYTEKELQTSIELMRSLL